MGGERGSEKGLVGWKKRLTRLKRNGKIWRIE